ncbi:MAG TPA: hypothetical protein VGD54_14760 [Steroidobacteraceae bacterium]
MTQYQQIAKGLLGLTHPEIFVSAGRKESTREEVQSSAAAEEPTTTRDQRRQDGNEPRASGVVRAFKFAFAALVAGSRTVPLGDNRQVTHELGEYGARLHFDSRCNS